MGISNGDFDWRNFYGGATADDRRLKSVKGNPMTDTGTAGWDTNTTWPIQFVVAPETREPLALFIVPSDDGAEHLVSAHSKEEAWQVVARRLDTPAWGWRVLPDIIEIPLPTQAQLLHVFEGGKEK